MPHVRFHDLRHTAASLMLTRGVHPKAVSDLLGHATVSITLDTYSHVLPACTRRRPRDDDVLRNRVGVSVGVKSAPTVSLELGTVVGGPGLEPG